MSNEKEAIESKNSVIKNIKRSVIIAVLVLAIAGSGFAAFMFWPGSISRTQAQEIAISHIGGGTASWPSHDFEEFRRTWEVQVFHEGRVISVYVSRFTGQVVYMEIDGW